MNQILKELKDNDIKVVETKDEKTLNVLQSRKGEIAYTKKEDKFHIYNGTKWVEYTHPTPSLSMTQYEINKMTIRQLNYLTPEEKSEKYKLINNWQKKIEATYYAMIGKENNYYTIFRTGVIHELPNLGEGVLQCLQNVGDIYLIEETETGDAIEIWVQYEDEPIVMYLFPYDTGIVTIGE